MISNPDTLDVPSLSTVAALEDRLRDCAGSEEDVVRSTQPICLSCNRRPALACVRGTWRVVKHHDVCRQCWRSVMDSRRAATLAAVERECSASGRRRKPSRTRWGGGIDCRPRARS